MSEFTESSEKKILTDAIAAINGGILGLHGFTISMEFNSDTDIYLTLEQNNHAGKFTDREGPMASREAAAFLSTFYKESSFKLLGAGALASVSQKNGGDGETVH